MIIIPFRKKELVLCQLPGLSCMGCCTAPKVKNKNIIENQLKKNTERFRKTKDPHKFALDSGEDVASGSKICKTLIKEGDKVFCPSHPLSPYTKGKDMREYCIKDYWCATMKEFRTWPEERQKKMIEWIKTKNYNWHSYSLANDTGKSIKEFIEYEKKNLG